LNDSNIASTSSIPKDRFYEELKWMNNRIDDLSLTLSNCAHTTKNLVSVASKNNGSHIAHHGLSKPKNKVHKQKGKPTHHAHLCAKVQKCTTCGRKGHVAKFCNTTYKRIQNPAPYKNVHASQPHSHAPIPYSYDVVYKCTICGRRGHLAKFCYDAPHSAQKSVSHVSNKNASTSRNSSHYAQSTSTHTKIFHCSLCGRNGHLAKFCYDREPLFANKFSHTHTHHHHIPKATPSSNFGSKFAHGFFCDFCGMNGHLKEFCYDKLECVNAPSWNYNPRKNFKSYWASLDRFPKY